MNIKEDTNLFSISTSRRWKEVLFSSLAIVATSLCAYAWVGWGLLSISFIILAVWCAVINISDEEYCDMDKKKETIVIRKEGLLGGSKGRKVVVRMPMNEVVNVYVEQTTDKKRDASRVMLEFADGVSIPVTETYFTKKVDIQNTADKMRKFIGVPEELAEDEGGADDNNNEEK